jgi:hypothetical protein
MRHVLCYALAASMAMLAWGADTSTAKKKTTKRKTTVTAHKTAPRKTTSSKKGTSKGPAKKTSWRNRQLAPTPERYSEIQNALVAKGYLKQEEAGKGWNQDSVDALKHFQTAQNLDPNGKINSLSLIALGLGPKHDLPAKTAENPQ